MVTDRQVRLLMANFALRAHLDSLPGGGTHLRKDGSSIESVMSSSQSGMVIAIDAGQHLMVTTPTGHSLDLTSDSTWTTNIPGVIVQPLLTRGRWDDDPQFAAPHAQIVIPNAPTGDYNVLLTGPQTASVVLGAMQYDPAGISTAFGSAAVSPSTIARYRLHHDALGGETLTYLGTTAVEGRAPVGQLQMSIYPNPIASIGRIGLTLDCSRNVAIDVYDVGGRRVSTVAKERLGAGTHTFTWPRSEDDAIHPGLYFVRVTGTDVTITHRIVVIGGR